jgi:asparagine synthetase B (glutamine-hydrolysing)
MCGIAGSVVFKLPYVTVTDSLLRRSPNTQYGFTKDNADLFHLRLSITDIANGQQAMLLAGTPLFTTGK